MTQHPREGYKPLLPQVDKEDCRDLNSTIQCFDAGIKNKPSSHIVVSSSLPDFPVI